MAHAARALGSWMSAMVLVAITASCITWLIVSRENKLSIKAIDGASVAKMLRDPRSTEHCLYKVNKEASHSKNTVLTWREASTPKNFSLDPDHTRIKVEVSGVYLVYIQLTYSLQKDRDNSKLKEDLAFRVKIKYSEIEQEFMGAFDTRELTVKEEDAHLSAFFLLELKAGNGLSVLALPSERIKYDDVEPFSSYITIVRYADWSG